MVTLEYIAQDDDGNALHLRREVARSEFVEAIEDMLDRTLVAIDKALDDANLQAADIDRVLLVGGSTRIPAVWAMVAERMAQDPHMEIDPDAAVALGAAVQAGIIAGEEIDAILVDVTPMSLGIETARINMAGQLSTDQFVPLIHRNATIPVQKSEIFTTMFPGQETIHVKVYQGEQQLASHNVLLGDFMVENLTPNASDGLAQVTINFQLDINGILDVTVTERATGRQQSERLTADRQRLTPEQIAASQSRLSDDYASTPVTFDDETRALLDRARVVLETIGPDSDLGGEILAAIDAVYDAAQEDDPDALQTASDELVDLLVEAEEE